MSVQINYKVSNTKKVSTNLILFVDEKFNISGLKKYISNSEFAYISDLLGGALAGGSPVTSPAKASVGPSADDDG